MLKLWTSIPDWASLVEGPINFDGGATRGWARGPTHRVSVVKDTSCGQNRIGEPGWNHKRIIKTGLVHGDQEGARLADMDIYGGVCDLEGMSPFHLYQFQNVVLDSEVERVLQANIWYSEPVSLPCKRIL